MYEDVHYIEPYLKEIIVRVDFVTPIALDKTLPSNLVSIALDNFPIKEPTEKLFKQVKISGNELNQQQITLKEWIFHDRDREKQLTLTSSSVFISYKKYTTYEDIKKHFRVIIEELQKAFPDAKSARFGLRYINIIEINSLENPINWDSYIHESLLKPANFFIDKNLTRLFHVAELKYDDIDIKFQFGMPNPDYPASIKRPVFIMDLDGYVQSAHSLSDSLIYMDKAHKEIQHLFEESITDKLRGCMNGKPI